MPATTTTAAAAPMRITKARGRAPRRGPAPFASGVGTAPTTPGSGTGVVMRRRYGGSRRAATPVAGEWTAIGVGRRTTTHAAAAPLASKAEATSPDAGDADQR